MLTHAATQQIEYWLLSRFVPYARNPRKNDHAVDRMVASIREFGLKIPVLARSSGEVVDGHLRLKAADKLGITEIPVILTATAVPLTKSPRFGWRRRRESTNVARKSPRSRPRFAVGIRICRGCAWV